MLNRFDINTISYHSMLVLRLISYSVYNVINETKLVNEKQCFTYYNISRQANNSSE